MASNAITNTGGVTDMWVEMNCSICGYRESTDHDTRTESQIQSVCDRGCPRCGNTDHQNPYWFQHGPDGEITGHFHGSVRTKFLLVKWWPDTPTPEHQRRIDAGLCK
jgi:predicted nucleic-acid-binding Zn-ribbon protein